ncbi:MAG: cytochrome C [Betaproteobacteria bacterium]
MTRTRLLYLAAAALAAAALVLPLWGITMSAPQYPDESLHLEITRTGITGDVREIETLQKYVGVRFPTELPELTWATRGILALSAILAIGALVGGNGAGRWYRRTSAAAFVIFLIASAAVVQFRLYEVGHERDPHAPLRSIRDFTPPLVGPTRVGNFTVWSFPHAGGVTLVLSAALAVAGAARRNA